MWVLDPDCPFGFNVPDLWKPHDISILCESVTRHGRREYDDLLTSINDHIVNHIDGYMSKELVTCSRGFQNANLSFPHTAILISERVGLEVQTAAALREELATMSIPRLCFFMDSMAHFGYDDPAVQRAIRSSCKYLSDRVDSVPERSAIRVCWSIALYGLSGK